MVTVEYASELDPLLDLSLPSDWLVAVVPEPGQLLADADRREDRLLGQLLSGGDDQRVVASRVAFLYYRGIDPDPDTASRENQLSVRYDFEHSQYELLSVLEETTVHTADEAVAWVNEALPAVETVVDTSLILMALADDVHGLGQSGVRGLVETFETCAAIREADIDELADVPYVTEESAAALQTALEDRDTDGKPELTPIARELQTIDGPLILNLQRGPVSGELVPAGASEPTYRSIGFGDTAPNG